MIVLLENVSQSTTAVYAAYPSVNYAGYTWLELSPITGRKHQVWIRIQY